MRRTMQHAGLFMLKLMMFYVILIVGLGSLLGCGAEVSGVKSAEDKEVTPVQLCDASFVATYPSTFPEYALCIDNHLYVVFSDNGGFLTMLPPRELFKRRSQCKL